MTPTAILQAIWSRSEGDFVFLPIRYNGEWFESDPVRPMDVLLQPDINADQYFTPVKYTEPRRLPDNQGRIGVLYADLDSAYDREALESIPPTVLWESSPGNLQAVWFLTEAVPAVEAIDLNRKLSYFLSADHGSWIPTKVLRIPESRNMKRGGVQGQLLSYDFDIEYPPALLAADLPDSKPRSVLLDAPHPAVPDLTVWRTLLRKHWPRLSHRDRILIAQAQVSDRSFHLAMLAKSMARVSVPPHEIFGILSRLPTNKFSGRPDVLWKSVVLTAVADVSAGR